MDIQKMIEKYGSEITKTLKIASTQLYDKVLWYVRINGIIGLIETVIVSGLGIGFGIWSHLICKKNKLYKDKYDGFNPVSLVIYTIAFLIWFILFAVIDIGIIPNISKVFAPEYWIINQIVNKVK